MRRTCLKCGHAQRGNVLLVMLALIALVVGAWQFDVYRTRAKAAAEVARAEAARQAQAAQIAAQRARLEAAREALAPVDEVLSRWIDAVKVADSASRVALAGPVATLQTIRRDAEHVAVPPCLAAGKIALVSAMDHTVDGFLKFMQNEADLGKYRASTELSLAAEALAQYRSARAGCLGGEGAQGGSSP